ncbi:unnamed protein product [Brassica napus]|uniref:(rape) hypothetical protein n=1 Tax=Brassica napus TaxID=3708 RepID=A0A816KBL4_BRANA|nr:unnamed protein product [Brassica napus]
MVNCIHLLSTWLQPRLSRVLFHLLPNNPRRYQLHIHHIKVLIKSITHDLPSIRVSLLQVSGTATIKKARNVRRGGSGYAPTQFTGHSLDWFPLIFIIKLLSAVSNVKLTSSTEIHSSIAIRFTFLAKFIEITTPPTTIFTELFRHQPHQDNPQ